MWAIRTGLVGDQARKVMRWSACGLYVIDYRFTACKSCSCLAWGGSGAVSTKVSKVLRGNRTEWVEGLIQG